MPSNSPTEGSAAPHYEEEITHQRVPVPRRRRHQSESIAREQIPIIAIDQSHPHPYSPPQFRIISPLRRLAIRQWRSLVLSIITYYFVMKILSFDEDVMLDDLDGRFHESMNKQIVERLGKDSLRNRHVDNSPTIAEHTNEYDGIGRVMKDASVSQESMNFVVTDISAVDIDVTSGSQDRDDINSSNTSSSEMHTVELVNIALNSTLSEGLELMKDAVHIDASSEDTRPEDVEDGSLTSKHQSIVVGNKINSEIPVHEVKHSLAEQVSDALDASPKGLKLTKDPAHIDAPTKNARPVEASEPSVIHIFQYGAPRTATTTQFNMVCISLFLHFQIYHPELLNNTICNNADYWGGTPKPRVDYFLQHDGIPQAVKSHVGTPPESIKNTTIIFTTAFNKTEAAKKEAELKRKGFNVGLIQDMETLVDIGINATVKMYAKFFKLKSEHVPLLITYFNHWDKLRQCCGLQMSKYFRNTLLPPSDKNLNMEGHKFCTSVDIDNLEAQFMSTEMFKLIDRYKLMRPINRVSLVDGDLNGSYCSRYNDAVRKYGITGNRAHGGLNSRFSEVENHWEENNPNFDGLFRITQKPHIRVPSKTDSSSIDQPFSPWVQEYISFHQSSIINGRLTDNARYIIYQCKDGPVVCGGVGDRIIGMIKMFYLAMITRRVLLIDADFPVPLQVVLSPAHIEWNVTSFPETTLDFEDLTWNPKGNTFFLRPEIRGYRILKTTGYPRKLALDDICESSLMVDHMRQHQWTHFFNQTSLAAKAHEAFRAMFKMTQAVIDRAEEFKVSAGISGPYFGMHMRKGDAAMGVEGPSGTKVKLQIDRTTNNTMMMSCYHKMKEAHPEVTQGYLASDDIITKQNMSDIDPSISFAKEMRPFHVDLLARNGFSAPKKLNSTDQKVFQGMIDTWAEMLVLAKSTCFVLSKSMFSFGSSYMRGPNKCTVLLEFCELPSPAKREEMAFYGEAIYQRGFVLG